MLATDRSAAYGLLTHRGKSCDRRAASACHIFTHRELPAVIELGGQNQITNPRDIPGLARYPFTTADRNT